MTRGSLLKPSEGKLVGRALRRSQLHQPQDELAAGGVTTDLEGVAGSARHRIPRQTRVGVVERLAITRSPRPGCGQQLLGRSGPPAPGHRGPHSARDLDGLAARCNPSRPAEDHELGAPGRVPTRPGVRRIVLGRPSAGARAFDQDLEVGRQRCRRTRLDVRLALQDLERLAAHALEPGTGVADKHHRLLSDPQHGSVLEGELRG